MEVRLDKHKNDQLREGSLALISTQPGELGAVALTQRLMKEMNLQADDHLLSNLVKAKSGWKTKKGSLQDSRAGELSLEAVAGAGLQAEMFSLHSLRLGGSTAAAAAKVPQQLLKRHGGWHSEAVNSYIKESLDNMLLPSNAVSCTSTKLPVHTMTGMRMV